MATAPITELIDSVTKLRNCCKDLKQELSVLDICIKSKDDTIIITHDCALVINVYSTNKLKAYIPKKYNGFTVKFTEIVEGEELKFNLKEEILV